MATSIDSGKLTYERLERSLLRHLNTVANQLPELQDAQRVRDLKKLINEALNVARAGMRKNRGVDPPAKLKSDLKARIARIHAEHDALEAVDDNNSNTNNNTGSGALAPISGNANATASSNASTPNPVTRTTTTLRPILAKKGSAPQQPRPQPPAPSTRTRARALLPAPSSSSADDLHAAALALVALSTPVPNASKRRRAADAEDEEQHSKRSKPSPPFAPLPRLEGSSAQQAFLAGARYAVAQFGLGGEGVGRRVVEFVRGEVERGGVGGGGSQVRGKGFWDVV